MDAEQAREVLPLLGLPRLSPSLLSLFLFFIVRSCFFGTLLSHGSNCYLYAVHLVLLTGEGSLAPCDRPPVRIKHYTPLVTCKWDHSLPPEKPRSLGPTEMAFDLPPEKRCQAQGSGAFPVGAGGGRDISAGRQTWERARNGHATLRPSLSSANLLLYGGERRAREGAAVPRGGRSLPEIRGPGKSCLPAT